MRSLRALRNRVEERVQPPSVALVARPPARIVQRPRFRPSLGVALAVGCAGLGVNLVCLRLSDHLVTWFPSVTDVLQAQLPYVNFGVPGELAFVVFLLLSATLLISRQRRAVPSVLCVIGVFYAVRGVFMLLLPIGSPPTAPPMSEQFVLYPYADHAYFPGGHAGLMTILGLSVSDVRWRRFLLAMMVLFALGEVMTRAHYTADVIAGGALGYGLFSWGKARLAGFRKRDLTPIALP